jgi:hypothetical protein
MIKVTWTFDNFYTEEEFQEKFSEQNDVLKEGYYVLAKEWENVDSMDDMSIRAKVETVK